MKIFEVLTTVLLLIGAAVGGVLGLLIPRVTTGLILGFLVGLFIDAVRLPPLLPLLYQHICICVTYVHYPYYYSNCYMFNVYMNAMLCVMYRRHMDW